jgi:hypothetical protein
VSFSEGGYGHWALLIGGNYSCSISAQLKRNGKFKNECVWKDGEAPLIPANERNAPLFPEPMR